MCQFVRDDMNQSLVSFVACRKTLMTVATMIGRIGGQSNASEFLASLSVEIERLRNGDATSNAWIQAANTVDGPESYGIQQCGLWPETQSDGDAE